MANHICLYWEHDVAPYFLARERGGKSPALRPSHPQVCRKRVFRQGKPFGAASRALTFMPWLPASYTCGRRTRKPLAGARSKEARRPETQKQRHKKAFPASRIPIRGGHDTCKSVPAYAPQSFPDTYGVASHAAFRYPRRHALYADLALRRILTARLAHSVQSFAAYRLLICRMRARRCRHAHRRHAGYTPAIFPMPASWVPSFRTDACLFVRPCLRGPAYVSSIRCAYSLTAGEGQSPFEPRKGKRAAKARGRFSDEGCAVPQGARHAPACQ